MANFLVIDDAFNKEFVMAIDLDRPGLLQCAGGEFFVIVLMEGFYKGGMEGWEDVWGGWDVNRHCRGVGVCVRDKVRSIKAWHKFGNPFLVHILVFSAPIECT